MRRARPTAGCGISPSPPISLEVSTITTRLLSASTRAASRSMVVLPTPGRPSKQDALAALDDVLDDVDGAVDGAADAAGQADDVAAPVADGGDAVQRALHARRGCRRRTRRCARRQSRYLRVAPRSALSTTSRSTKRAVGTRPRSRMTSSRLSLSSASDHRLGDARWQYAQQGL